jgi:hypothetical protein
MSEAFLRQDKPFEAQGELKLRFPRAKSRFLASLGMTFWGRRQLGEELVAYCYRVYARTQRRGPQRLKPC